MQINMRPCAYPHSRLSAPRLSWRYKDTLVCPICAKGGGFGAETAQKQSGPAKAGKKGGKQKKRRAKQPSNPMQPAQPSPNSREELFVQKMEEKAQGSAEDNLAFEERLRLLREQGEASRTEREKAQPQREGGILNAGPLSAPPQPSRRVAEPRSDEQSQGPLGLPQVLVGALSLVLVAVFVVTSGFGPGGGTTPQPQLEGLSEDQRKDLEERAKELDERLKTEPADVEALRELSDLSAVLGDSEKSSSLAERVTQADPADTRAWLALADARGRSSDFRGAAVAYEKSLEAAGPPSLPQLQGLATALVSDKRPAEAIQRLQSFESRAGQAGAVGPVELQLLIGKVYSQWDRHFASALAVYDGIIEKYPDDFRGFLAKGALLKDNGRKGDAQRMFIQARFLAPAEARSVVDNVANR